VERSAFGVIVQREITRAAQVETVKAVGLVVADSRRSASSLVTRSQNASSTIPVTASAYKIVSHCDLWPA
jgi:hypothetical protein